MTHDEIIAAAKMIGESEYPRKFDGVAGIWSRVAMICREFIRLHDGATCKAKGSTCHCTKWESDEKSWECCKNCGHHVSHHFSPDRRRQAADLLAQQGEKS